jgi:hypothetical protein
MAGLFVWAGCGIANSAANHEADKHADTAAIVMTRGLDPVASGDAAQRVTGTARETTIEALRADNSEFSTRCYAYTLARVVAVHPHRMAHCPSGQPLVLPPPAPPIDMTAQALEIRSDEECILATLPAVGPARVSPPTHGSDCLGG